MQKTINQVRQILVNELGLTRDSVREEANAYIRQTLERMLSGKLETLVSKEAERIIGERINTWYRASGKFQEMVELEIRQAIVKRLNIDLKGAVTVTAVARAERFVKITDPKDYEPSDCKQHINVTFDTLKAKLGEPFYNGTEGFPDDDDKIDVCWCFKVADNAYITIWNYKNGPVYGEAQELAEIHTFSFGFPSAAVLKEFSEHFELGLEL